MSRSTSKHHAIVWVLPAAWVANGHATTIAIIASLTQRRVRAPEAFLRTRLAPAASVGQPTACLAERGSITKPLRRFLQRR
jgi:hypothetical protein